MPSLFRQRRPRRSRRGRSSTKPSPPSPIFRQMSPRTASKTAPRKQSCTPGNPQHGAAWPLTGELSATRTTQRLCKAQSRSSQAHTTTRSQPARSTRSLTRSGLPELSVTKRSTQQRDSRTTSAATSRDTKPRRRSRQEASRTRCSASSSKLMAKHDPVDKHRLRLAAIFHMAYALRGGQLQTLTRKDFKLNSDSNEWHYDGDRHKAKTGSKPDTEHHTPMKQLHAIIDEELRASNDADSLLFPHYDQLALRRYIRQAAAHFKWPAELNWNGPHCFRREGPHWPSDRRYGASLRPRHRRTHRPTSRSSNGPSSVRNTAARRTQTRSYSKGRSDATRKKGPSESETCCKGSQVRSPQSAQAQQVENPHSEEIEESTTINSQRKNVKKKKNRYLIFLIWKKKKKRWW